MKKRLLFLSLISAVVLQADMNMKMMKHHKMFQSVPEDKAQLVGEQKDKRHCVNCGMDLVKFYKTSHAAKVDGKELQFCSIHCLAKDIKDGKKVEDIKVTDTHTLKLIDATKAYYVVGSNVKGTMSMVSKYAFASKEDAEAFAKKHGGKVVGFEEALKVAMKDFNK